MEHFHFESDVDACLHCTTTLEDAQYFPKERSSLLKGMHDGECMQLAFTCRVSKVTSVE